MSSIWTSRTDEIVLNDELVGFTVEGTDGKIGKVDHVNYAGTCVTVATGGLLKKAKHLIPALAIKEIDLDTQTIQVALTSDEVTGSPEFDPHSGVDEACEALVEKYYGERLSR